VSERLKAVTLASASPRRLELLRGLGLAVTVVRSSYEEDNALAPGVAPAALAQFHAEGKAAAAESQGPPVLVAADTIVDVDGVVLGKPRDVEDARRMLALLSGREHLVHTGFTVIDRARMRQISGVESTLVRFLPLSAARIGSYVESGEPMDKAGAYGIQGQGALNVASVNGDFYAVMGLPLARLGLVFADLGFEVA
jgi:nucleoside triphosphate pyrophosphatase